MQSLTILGYYDGILQPQKMANDRASGCEQRARPLKRQETPRFFFRALCEVGCKRIVRCFSCYGINVPFESPIIVFKKAFNWGQALAEIKISLSRRILIPSRGFE